jgi:hypothetical protein
MKTNMGYTDRITRVVIAVLIGVLYYGNVISGTLAIILGILALVFIATSFVGLCPLYLPFGINTRNKIHAKE